MAIQPARNLQQIIPALFTGQGGQLMTPEQIQRQQQMAAALMQGASDTSPISHWSQGATRLVDAFNGVRRERGANASAQRGAEYNQSLLRGLLGGMGGGSPSPVSAGGGAGLGMAALPASSGGSAAPMAMPKSQMASYVRDGLVQRGLPSHVADAFVVNFQDESGLNPGINEANPIVPGSRGGFGLYQLTGPRRREYEAFAANRGVNVADPDAQMDFLMQELQGSEARAARNILSAPDTATAAQAIVNDFLRPAPEHRSSRARRYAGLATSDAAYNSTNGMRDVPDAQLPPEEQSMIADLRARQEYNPANVRPYNGVGAQGEIQDPMIGTQVASLDPSIGAPSGPSPETMAALTGQPVQPQLPAAQPYQYQPYVAPQVQVAQAAPQGINPALLEALTSPYADDSTRQIGQMLFGQQQQQQLAAQQAAAQQQALQEQRAYERWSLGDQRAYDASLLADDRRYTRGNQLADRQYDRDIVLQDRSYTEGREDQRYAVDDAYRQQALVPSDIREYEYYRDQELAAGRQPMGVFEYQQAGRRAGATSITNNVGESDAFRKKLDEGSAQTFVDMSNNGVTARSNLRQIDRLDGLLQAAPSGSEAVFKQMLGEWGIKTEGLDNLQSAQALINQMVPQQRPAGSGPMSDADLALFKQSLPRLINQPGGNKIIIETMRGIAQYEMQMGDIADQVMDGTMTPAQAREAMRGLSNPLEGFADMNDPNAVHLDEVPVQGTGTASGVQWRLVD